MRCQDLHVEAAGELAVQGGQHLDADLSPDPGCRKDLDVESIVNLRQLLAHARYGPDR